ncbi:methylamine utilization protein MauE [Opitutaceae bacterium TAV4]|nr:methylamine utilization protein MauE [Opitutaceae bacterium TAV4]RRK00423.1 methylamine utilization protein MauE [Opitutaceae bacterium TAV3]
MSASGSRLYSIFSYVWLPGLRVLLTGLLAVSGVAKLADVVAFAGDLENYRMLSPGSVSMLAVLFPCLEVTLAVTWWVRRIHVLVGGVVLALLEVYTAAVASAWWQGLDIRAGCFGRFFPLQLEDVVLRNFVVVLAAALVLRADIRASLENEKSEIRRGLQ